jgi:hypothetical protein
MTDDTVKRLRQFGVTSGMILREDIHAAADRIEALEREVALLKTERRMREDWVTRISATLKKVEARAERLRAALEAIAVRAGTFEGRGNYIAYVELAGEIEKMADAARNGEKP